MHGARARGTTLERSLQDASLLLTSKLVHYLLVKKHRLIECACKLV